MKKILYILDDGKRSFTFERIAGFREAIRKSAEEINFYIFRSAGLAEYESIHNCGEYNIYRLPNFSDYDGIFLDINNFHSRSANLHGSRAATYVIRAAAASKKPVVTIAAQIADFYYVGIDNHAAMTSMIEHLHKNMGLKDFWFLMGPADNYENVVRTEALKEYCMANGLNHADWRFHAESYAISSGIHGFEHLWKQSDGKLPEAILCANDNIASGACQTAASYGVRIPKDVFVTGFDNMDIAAYSSPSITTVDQYRFDLGRYCINVMESIWRGEDTPKTTYTPTGIVLRESTGHTKPTEEMLEARVAEALRKDAYTENFSNRLCAAQYYLPGCKSIEEMCKALEPLIKEINCKSLHIVLDPAVYDYADQVNINNDNDHVSEKSALFGNGSLHIENYPREMELTYRWTEKTGSEFPHKRIQSLFPEFDFPESGQDILFTPLHFMEYTVGYLVIRDCVEILHTRNVAPIVNTLTMAMRGFFDGKKLEYFNQMLSGLSMKDNLTGLYNRLGYHRLATKLFNETTGDGKRLGVLFLDMDNMKYFNDTFGHSCGDDAICSISTSISKSIPKEAVAIRYGGDEFLILFPANTEEEITSLIEDISAHIPEEADARKMPDVPGVSSGFVLTEPTSSLTLNDYVEEADKLMYDQKLMKKAAGGH
ncbi:MAG: diguanylate cyclase [Lachnospiraceae bacterium]|nr:diguanylate cyclase [Lachnospiraceae bacterium]